MRPALLRGSVVALALGVVAAVAWTLRRPAALPPDASPNLEPPGAAAVAPATRMDDLVYVHSKEGRETFRLRARRMAGREQEQVKLEIVEMVFSYVSDGQPAKGTITSDECVYFPQRQEAYFQGHVRLVTEDEVELRTEQLVYKGQEGKANSGLPVEFRKKRLSGRAKRMDYEAEAGRLGLAGQVAIRVDDDEQPPLEIESERAALLRASGEARFEGGVELVRGGDKLTSQELTLWGTEEELDRMRASGKVVVRSTSDALPGKTKGRRKSGPRELSCQHFEASLRPDRSLQDAVAKDDAVLVVLPAAGEARERRTLMGSVLTFRGDEQGRLIEIQGQKDTEFLGEPLPPEKDPPRSVKSRNFQAIFEPATGAAESIEFNKDVDFTRGSQKASADRGYFHGKDSRLVLTEGPSLTDTEQGSRLEAETIEVMTVTGDARARYGVRHVLERRAGRSAGFPGSEAEATVASARFFEYDKQAKTAVYSDGALLRSGKSELRADRIRRVERETGERLLSASGAVFTLLLPKPAPGAAEQSPLEARAREMAYDEAKREATYKGDVSLAQAEVRTKSQQALLLLGEDGGRLERLQASEAVELRQAGRVATGQKAVYTPADKTIVVTGDKVELVDDRQHVSGRSLTFFVGDDRILVDGREEARTETILRKKP